MPTRVREIRREFHVVLLSVFMGWFDRIFRPHLPRELPRPSLPTSKKERDALSPIEFVTLTVEDAIKTCMASNTQESFWVTHYGANDIHPRHLVYWIVVQSDREKRRLEKDSTLMASLRRLLDEHDYPAEGRSGVHIGFESHETVQRDSGGNYWHHWK